MRLQGQAVQRGAIAYELFPLFHLDPTITGVIAVVCFGSGWLASFSYHAISFPANFEVSVATCEWSGMCEEAKQDWESAYNLDSEETFTE